jgi:hypothetical protein
MLAGPVRTLEMQNGAPGQHRKNISIRLRRGLGIGSAGLWGRGIVWPLRAAGQVLTHMARQGSPLGIQDGMSLAMGFGWGQQAVV